MSAIRADRLLAVNHAVEHVKMLLAEMAQDEEHNGRAGEPVYHQRRDKDENT
jgi:hypothetical protein